MIVLEGLTFGYPNAASIFQDFSWRVNRGETWAVIGPSGCGKTTLLYLLAGLRLPDRGQILIDGQPLVRPRPHTGLILQDYGLLPWATVSENAALGLRVRDFYGPDGTHAPRDYLPSTHVNPWLERLGLTAVAEQYPAQISGGQRQRTAIARTLAVHPDLLLMDEPFSSLDALTREDLQDLTLELCIEQNLTLVIVTHAIEEAATLGKKVLVLGLPPNRQPVIVDNPAAGTPAYRQSPAYQAVCHVLRTKMEAA
jgi:ABC-type nitrate/sulfonate/bicarbonate transport system ATPase subunit